MKTMLMAIGLVAVLMWPGAVYGQLSAGEDGHALDANPRQGSGGVNHAVPRHNFQRGNDLVTGNTGFDYFRGDVGYRSPRDFAGASQSDTLYRFQANALGSAPGVAPGVSRQLSIQRSFSSVTAESLPTSTQQPFISFDPSSNRIYATSAVAPGGDYLLRPSAQVRAVGQGGWSDDGGWGRMAPVTASSLTGLRLMTLPAVEGSAEAIATTGPAPDSLTLAREQLGNQFFVDRRARFHERSAVLDATGESMESLAQPHASMVDFTLIERLDVGSTSPGRFSFADLARRLQETLDGDPPLPIDSAYASLIEQIRQSRRQTGEAMALDQSDVLQDAFMRSLLEEEMAWDPEQPLTPELLALASQRQNEAFQAMLDQRDPQLQMTPQEFLVQLQEMIEAQEQLDLPEDAAAQAPTMTQLAREAVGLIDQIDYELPRLATLAGERQSRINELYQQAESLLGDGKYYDAISAYRRIVLTDEHQALARVGEVHAMIGAGLIRSAGEQLHRLFRQHPELIAARYERNLFPELQRLSSVQQQLIEGIEDGRNIAQSALLLAYLGYQFQSPRLVEYGVLMGQTQTPGDPLWIVLARIWNPR